MSSHTHLPVIVKSSLDLCTLKPYGGILHATFSPVIGCAFDVESLGCLMYCPTDIVIQLRNTNV